MIEVPCIRSNKNTGKPDCPFDPSVWLGFFLAPLGNAKIPAASRVDQDTLKAFINAQLQHNNPALRWHHIGRLEDWVDKSTAVQTQTLPNGVMVATDRMHLAGEYQIIQGGKYYHQALISFNNQPQNYLLFPYDRNNVLMGTEDIDIAQDMTGYTLSMLFAYDYKPATSKAVSEYKGMIAFENAAEMNENFFATKCNFDLTKLKGVQDVEIVATPGTADGQHVLKLYTGGRTLNIVKSLGTAAATATNFLFTNKATGATVTFTAALSADGESVVLSASLADTDYVDGADMLITLNTVSQLATNGLKYFEAIAPATVVATNP
ncbi:hypothetical protein JST56_07245 [Candidatus Dependentiae bacterium]|nr:hypothetical protein [Candidatus Dependentiae bacterium]